MRLRKLQLSGFGVTATSVEQVPPVPEAVTVKPVMAAPPSSSGASQETVAVVLPAVAVTDRGALGVDDVWKTRSTP